MRTSSTNSCAIVKKSIYTDQYRKLLKNLTEARKEAGFTQAQLAKKLGKPQSFVAKYELGERRLDVVELMTIAEHLDIDLKTAIKGLEE